MSKTTPVRWWRDDAIRYQSRGPAQSRITAVTRPVADWLREAQDKTLALRVGDGVSMGRRWAPTEPPDPVADIKVYLADQRREIERMNGNKP